MKTLKYIIASLVIAIAVAGCAGGTGTANLDTHGDGYQSLENE